MDVGLKLDVEPTVSVDGEIAIKISLEVSNIISQIQTKSGSIAYQIGTRTAQTMLRLKDGENQVLAGLINSEDRRTGNKVPGFGDIPMVGRLFGQQTDDNTKTEIVLSITPRILRNLQKPVESNLEFDSGTESNLASLALSSQFDFVKVVPTGSTASDVSALKTSAQSLPVKDNVAPAASQAPVLSWQGPAELKVGDTAAISLVMQSSVPVVSLPLTLDFDAKSLQIVSVIEGDFLKQGAVETSFTSRIDPSGQLFMTNSRSAETGASGAGVVATVNFKVIALPAQSQQSTPSEQSTQSTQLPVFKVLSMAPLALGGKALAASALPPPLYSLRIKP
ncbi:Type II secretion system protein D [Polaromonas vacuolata]|uniref:Type II secretion system protein D n=1 Tax=Polaromonas vacuolata TaxID=37448 RepID=A0A6H2HAL6_9BURK|nr:cohesin domain-containing protein [Polaromonas vacuolata]QJC56921.1 Type II secretion system protein D [Polaromonas vacuolata]